MPKEEHFAIFYGILSSKLHNLFPTERSEGGSKTVYTVQVGGEGQAFNDLECWRRGTYHKTTMFCSLETLKNSAQHVFQPLFHFPVPPAH